MPRILIVAPSWVGDCVLAQPLFKRLHERTPGLLLDVLAPAWVADVFKFMPEVHEVIDSALKHGDLRIGERRRLGARLRQRQYERAIVLPNSAKSVLVPLFARIPRRTGYRGEMRFGLLNDVRSLDEKALPLMVERFAQLAENRGVAPEGPVSTPTLRVSESQRQAALARFALNADRPIVAFCPGAEYGPAKRWPTYYFAEVAKHLAHEHQIWIFGSKNDHTLGESIRYASGDACVNLCGTTTLADAIELLASVRFAVTNDSGLMHVAAALDRPLIALYGSSSPAFTPPLSTKAKVLSLNLECSPCFQRECPLGHFKCMLDLSPELVLAQLRTLPLTPLIKGLFP
jgi:heptosyltransferase II